MCSETARWNKFDWIKIEKNSFNREFKRIFNRSVSNRLILKIWRKDIRNFFKTNFFPKKNWVKLVFARKVYRTFEKIYFDKKMYINNTFIDSIDKIFLQFWYLGKYHSFWKSNCKYFFTTLILFFISFLFRKIASNQPFYFCDTRMVSFEKWAFIMCVFLCGTRVACLFSFQIWQHAFNANNCICSI